jgi:tmRNA-binding protein
MERELWIYNMDIPLYHKTAPQTVPGYDPQQNRKLLVKQKELAKISAAMDKKGIIPVPLLVYLDKR